MNEFVHLLMAVLILGGTASLSVYSWAKDYEQTDEPNAKVNQHREHDTPQTTGQLQDRDLKDLQLSRRIRQELLQDPTLSYDSKRIEIQANNRRITLKGNVPSLSEKKKVESYAYKIAGKHSVLSELHVATHSTR